MVFDVEQILVHCIGFFVALLTLLVLLVSAKFWYIRIFVRALYNPRLRLHRDYAGPGARSVLGFPSCAGPGVRRPDRAQARLVRGIGRIAR